MSASKNRKSKILSTVFCLWHNCFTRKWISKMTRSSSLANLSCEISSSFEDNSRYLHNTMKNGCIQNAVKHCWLSPWTNDFLGAKYKLVWSLRMIMKLVFEKKQQFDGSVIFNEQENKNCLTRPRIFSDEKRAVGFSKRTSCNLMCNLFLVINLILSRSTLTSHWHSAERLTTSFDLKRSLLFLRKYRRKSIKTLEEIHPSNEIRKTCWLLFDLNLTLLKF